MAVANEDLSTKAIGVTFRSIKMNSQVLADVLKIFLKKLDQQRHTGEQSLKALSQSNQSLKSLDIKDGQVGGTDFNIDAFKKRAKELHLDFSLIQNKEDPSQFTLFFKARDSAQLTHAMTKMIAKGFDKDQERPSIKETLAHAKQKSNALALERQSEKGMQRTKDRGVIDR